MKKIFLSLSLIFLFKISSFAQTWIETYNGDIDYYMCLPNFPQANPVEFNYGITETDPAHLNLTVLQPINQNNGEVYIGFVEAYINFYDLEGNMIGSSDFIQKSYPANLFSINYKVPIPLDAVKVEFYYAINGASHANEQLVVMER